MCTASAIEEVEEATGIETGLKKSFKNPFRIDKPKVPVVTDLDVKAKELEARRREVFRRLRQNIPPGSRSSTLLTGGAGVTGPVPGTPKTLLGS